MTSETRTLIELPDVSGLELTCLECGFVALFPMDKLAKIVPHCPQCNHVWFDQRQGEYGRTTYPAIDSLQAIATELRTLSRKDRTDLHVSVRLSVKPE
jgi:Zn-finger nucleic acid-binding protein